MAKKRVGAIFFLLTILIYISSCKPTSPFVPTATVNYTSTIPPTRTTSVTAIPKPTFVPSQTLTNTPGPTQAITPTPTPQSKNYGDSFSPSISADGRLVVFASRSDHLIDETIPQCNFGGTSYACTQIYLYNRESGEISLVTRADDGSPFNSSSSSPQISADGQWIAFDSEVDNLSTTNQQGIFLKDLSSNQVSFVAEGSDPQLSGDGSYLVFDDKKPGQEFNDVYLYDRAKDNLTNLSRSLEGGVTQGDSAWPTISADGNWIAFWSWSGLLGATANENCGVSARNPSCGDVYILNRNSGVLTRIVVGEGSGEGQFVQPIHLSADGQFLSFDGTIYVRNSRQQLMQFCAANLADWTADTVCLRGTLSGDGQWVVFTKGAEVYVQNRTAGQADLVSVGLDGTPMNSTPIISSYCDVIPSCIRFPDYDLSFDGQFIVFNASATNLNASTPNLCTDMGTLEHPCMEIYIRDRVNGVTEQITK